MANIASAIKRNRQNSKRQERNKHYKSMMRTSTKKFREAIESGDIDKAKELFPKTVSLIQKVGQKGIIHKNQANRRVSRLSSALKKASS